MNSAGEKVSWAYISEIISLSLASMSQPTALIGGGVKVAYSFIYKIQRMLKVKLSKTKLRM